LYRLRNKEVTSNKTKLGFCFLFLLYFDEMQAIHAKNDPDYEIRLQKTEAIMQHYMATHKNQPREVITIPVVVHVVHKDEAVVNSITEALIQSQIDILFPFGR